jgi:hypothetical protein
MRNPFEVGDTYRNRRGEYEVVELDEPDMVIRYADGQLLETTVRLQARIWRNLQAEKAAMEAAERRPKRKGSRSSRRGARFDGLRDGDFQRGVAGTSWRARTSLGGLLAEQVCQASGKFFQSYAVFRRAEVHVARPEHYHHKEKTTWRDAKFVFELDPEGACYGLYIEKNNGLMDEARHWPNLMKALSKDKGLQKDLLAAMRLLGLQWEVYAPGPEMLAQASAGADSLLWESAEGEQEAVSWPEFVKRLSAIDEDTWCNLYLCARMEKDKALEAGTGIADTAAKVYRALLPAYKAASERS